MEITSIERNKKNGNKVSVYIDGCFAFSMPEEDYIRLNIYEKAEISQEDIENIKYNVNFRSARAAAVRYLSLRLRSEKELELKLETLGFDRETIKRVVDDLKALGYINDKIYAQKYIFDRSKLKPKSKKLLKMELKSRGVSEDIIDNVFEGWEIDEVTVAQGLIKRKFGKYDLSDEKTLNKIKVFLKHRGFGYSVISEAIKTINNDY